MTPKCRAAASNSIEYENSDDIAEAKSPSPSTPGFYYLSADAQKQLPNYQYRGCDNSLLYHYVLSPFAQFCVDHCVGHTVAPNSITLFGLVWMITAYASYWYYVPSLEINGDEEPPRWIFIWNFISMLAYQTLDNMDGKQARRTGSSSPLGLLFDHGCDAINSIFGSANWIIGMGLIPADNLLACWALVFGPFCMFYIATWEQLHTGELVMPIVNGPNEGIMGGALLSLTSWWLGYSFWQETSWYDGLVATILPNNSLLPVLRNCDFVILASCFGFLQEILSKTYVVTKKYPDAAKGLLPFVVFAVSFLWIGQMDPTVWLFMPRTSLHLAMLLFTEMSTEIMSAHVTGQKFQYFRWQLIPLVALAQWIAIMGSLSQYSQMVEYWIVAYTWGLAAYLAMKITLLIHEFCHVLEIWCFDIVTPYPKSVTRGYCKEE